MNNMKPYKLILLLLFSMLIVSCKSVDSTTHQFVVSLESNPTTGYSWTYTQSGTGEVALANETYITTSSPKIVGAPGIQEFTFVPAQAGQVVLTFSYARPWEDAEPVKTHTVTLCVQEDGTIKENAPC